MLNNEEALIELAAKETAKILVISDCHGYIKNLRTILELAGSSCDALCFLGDGMEDLLEIAEEDSHVPPQNALLPPVVTFVRGNGDSDHYLFYKDSLTTIQVPSQICLTAAGKKIFMTHGHNFGVYYTTNNLFNYVKDNNFDAGLFGHTHVPFQDRRDNKLLLNPGSCALPRNHSEKSFAVLTISKDQPEIEYSFYSLP